MSASLLTIIATPELEERLVDWLLDRGCNGFTTMHCQGHGVQHDQLSAAEQVAGRQRRVAFWLQLPEWEARDLVSRLGARFGAAGLHYWLAPVTAAGPIGSSQDLEDDGSS
jgi:hypothetical protein